MTTAYEHLIRHYGSEDDAREKVEEYIRPFQGMVSFEVGCEIKAQEHGWQNPNRPRPVDLPTLSEEYFDTKIGENNSEWGDANITIEGYIAGISDVKFSEYDRDGEEIVDTFIIVRLEDQGYERDVRVYDHDGFESQSGKEIRANHLVTLFDRGLRFAIGNRIKMKSVRVKRKETIDGPAYTLNSGNFTTVRILETKQETEEILEESGECMHANEVF